MKKQTRRSCIGTLTLRIAGALILGLSAAVSTAGQEVVATSAPDRLSQVAGVDLVSLRPDGLLARRVEDAEHILSTIPPRIAQLRTLIQELDAAVEIKDSEIDIAKTEKDLARRQRDEAEEDSAERTEELREREKRLLERQRTAAERKQRFLQAQGELMRSQIASFEQERELNRLIEELAGLVDLEDAEGAPRRVAVRAQIAEQERETLEALERFAEMEERSADRRRDFIRAQLRVVEARAELAAVER
ncbi:MAG: hypothetical protein HKN73_05420 [Gemmatimonadetes bacterium]|nr:hypothetical protein [Gemmatimonadota bacterium]